MARTILVISDLHLGGEPGFQMCSPAGCTRIAEFVDWARHLPGDVWLVLNGDIVDFLAETDASGGFSAFTMQEEASRKFNRILSESGECFDALKRFVVMGKRLIVLLGNHDIELSLPEIRAMFMNRLGGGAEFLYDNEALTIGPVLIEHGNRYDGWNMVNHNRLREVRSKLSRREFVADFAAQPGSELVARVMNPIKRQFAFVDLLKPETDGVLPILAVLNPALFRKAGPALKGRLLAWYRGRLDDEGAPVDRDLVAAEENAERRRPGAHPTEVQLPAADEAAFAFTEELLAGLPSSGGLVSANPVAVRVLLKAFRKWHADPDRLFDVGFETKSYLEPANRLARRGFKVVAFGHTHHAKRVELDSGALYLNSGTWADLMRLPESVYTGSEDAGTQALQQFLDRVEANDIEAYRRQVATFVRIDLDDGNNVGNADTWFFDGPGKVSRVSTDGMKARLS